jgi:ribulose-phosphate 3-epimerase
MGYPVVKIAPSILAADFARLGAAVEEAEGAGADYIHVDVMDGVFVPNITIGIPVVAALRRVTRLPLDVHLMIVQPERYVEQFVEAGADVIDVQVEACLHLHCVLQTIRGLGCKAGVVLNPATPPVAISQVLGDLDHVLVMTVNPGFGGQVFIPSMLPKIGEIRRRLDAIGSPAELKVDGGIDSGTAADVVEAGARVLIAGTAVFGAAGGARVGVQAIRAAAKEGLERRRADPRGQRVEC